MAVSNCPTDKQKNINPRFPADFLFVPAHGAFCPSEIKYWPIAYSTHYICIQEFNEMKQYRLVTGIILSFFIALLALLPQVMQETQSGLAEAFINLARIFVFSLLCWVANQYLLQREQLPGGFKGQLPRIAASLFFAIILSCLLAYIFRKHFHIRDIPSLRQLYWRRSATGVAIFRGIFLDSFLYFIGYILHLNLQNQQGQLENERLKHENLEARLYVLRQQLSPHFLFNSLGILNTLTHEPPVRNYIVQLSHVYRYLLASHQGHLSGLKREMEFINSYLYIIKERFEEALQVNIDVDTAFYDKQIPPASLQLLIENAIKHNVLSTDEPLTIWVYTRGSHIVVKNSLNQKQAVTETNGVGLHNIAERYRLLQGGEVIIERDDKFFTVKLPLL